MKRLGIVAIIFAVALFGVSTVSAQMYDGSISGVVTDQDSGDSLSWSVVRAFVVDGPNWPVAIAMTDEAGNYELNVNNGDYHIMANKMGYLPEWWQEAPHRDEATVVTVTDDNDPIGIDFTLSAQSNEFGSISGTVTDFNSSEPIEDARVNLRRQGDYHFHRTAFTGADGTYLLDDIPPGTYLLACGKEGYIPVEYSDPVVVDGNDVTGIDFALEPLVFGSISGTVTDASTDEPMEGARVIARIPGNHHSHRMVLTGEDGTYTLNNLIPGDYRVTCHEWGYEPQEYPTLVPVNGDDVTGIDFALGAIVFGGISGIVTDASTNDPIENALVIAVDINHHFRFRTARTDENGEYSMDLRSGEYHVEARAMGYATEELDSTIVVVDEIITGIDFALSAVEFGTISGTVYDADSAAIPNAFVNAHKRFGWWWAHTRADSLGNYTLENLYPGQYRVKAFAGGYYPDYYDDLVEVENGADVTGIDFYLNSYGQEFDGFISGTVTSDETDAPIADALVVATGRIPGSWHIIRRYVHTDDDGSYTIENLPEIPFKVLCIADGYRAEFYDNKYHWHDADPVTPDAPGIDFGLEENGDGFRNLSGQVVQDDAPVAGAIVMAKQGSEVMAIGVTYPDGSYYIRNLIPGDYDIEVISPYLNEGYLENISVAFADAYEVDIVLSPTSADDDIVLPVVTTLSQNYPNPFNASTNISFYLDKDSEIELLVYDLLGRKVTTLESSVKSAGQHTVTWSGLDDNNNKVVSGMYLYVLKTADKTLSKRMVLLK